MDKNIRNFAILAHIDHGKSTLADRFLEITKTIESRSMREQYLDSMDLERERGITIKMQPVKMEYTYKNTKYDINLIDTPGHSDFSYEVSRALAAVESALLLVDATKGVQAQTVAHLQTALQLGLTIIPVLNKIDLPQAMCDEVEQEIMHLVDSFNYIPEDIYRVSAKNGEGVEELLNHIIELTPKPTTNNSKSLRALIFDSSYDDYQGVIAHTRIVDGSINKNEKIYLMSSDEQGIAKEVGIFSPQRISTDTLQEGSIGYIATGLKKIEDARIGDTITTLDPLRRSKEKIGGYQEPQPLVFSTIFPTQDAKYEDMEDACSKLKLNDSSLFFEPEYSTVLGRGMKAGFLGMLHMEIILERLKREHGLEIIITAPSVAYKVEKTTGEVIDIFNPGQYPEQQSIKRVQEPWVNLEIIIPTEYVNNAMNLLKLIRGAYKDTEYLGMNRVVLRYEAPLSEIISGFYDNLKNTTSGFGSLSYKVIDYRDADLVKMNILLAGDVVESLSRIVPKKTVEQEGRKLVEKIKNIIPQEQFAVSIQAAIGGKIIARETKSASKKNVTAGLYGGDFSRKKKQLEKQKRGKKRLKEMGKISLSSDTLIKLFN